jgi:manganese/zinc/iron transport system ATP- binding protein
MFIPFPSPPQAPTALSVRGLTVAYHEAPVLRVENLDIPQGVVAGIIGPNGAGKSTFLKACLNLLPRLAGEVRFLGQPYQQARHSVSYVPQRGSVDWDFPTTVLDVVMMGLYAQVGWVRPLNKKHRQIALHALEQVGLSDFAARQISQLSGGQQQRTFLARALVQNAQIYLMDEPFAAVDAVTEKAIVDLLHTLRAEGKTVLVVHHDLQTVEDYFDWVTLLNVEVMANGETWQTFTDANLRRTYGGRLSALKVQPEPALRMAGD